MKIRELENFTPINTAAIAGKIYLVLMTCLLWCFGCSSNVPAALDSNPVEENLLLFDRALNDIFNEVNGYLQPADTVYYIIQEEQVVAQQFLDNRFQEYLIERDRQVFEAGVEVINNLRSSGRNGKAISLAQRRMQTDYEYAEGFSKNGKLLRRISVQVFCKVVDTRNGRILAAQTFDKVYSDVIAEQDVSSVQRPGLPFTVGILEEKKSGLKDFLEYGTVLTGTGIILYLLFSTRSK